MSDGTHYDEEPWEAEVGALLRGLPTVEPPHGFLASAVDRRPLRAGRTMFALLALAVGVVIVTGVAGLSERGRITPELDVFTERHLAAQASLFDTSRAAGSDNNDGTGEGDEGTDAAAVEPGDGASAGESSELGEAGDLLIDLPDGYERAATVVVDDISQAVYDYRGEAVSIFIQEGEVDWSTLPVAGRRTVGGFPAWVDEERVATIVQVSGAAVAIVGVGPDDIEGLIDGLRARDRSLFDRFTDAVDALTVQLGFPTSS